MSFALYRRPGAVVFLDDDPDYLEMLAEVMPLDWLVRLLMRPVACIEMLLAEPPDDERERLIWAMEQCGWVQAKAARLLRVTPRQLGYALSKYSIEVRKF